MYIAARYAETLREKIETGTIDRETFEKMLRRDTEYKGRELSQSCWRRILRVPKITPPTVKSGYSPQWKKIGENEDRIIHLERLVQNLINSNANLRDQVQEIQDAVTSTP